MNETIPSQPPVPPSRHDSQTGALHSSTSLDALGAELVRSEEHNLNKELAASHYAFAQEYWDDMQQFYGIEEADAEEVTLKDVLEKYDFSPASRDYIKLGQLGTYTLNAARESASYWANSDQSFNKEWLDRDIERVRNELRETLSDPHNDFMLNLYARENAPFIFNNMRTYYDESDGTQRMRGWGEWLTDKATPEQFMNFLQWHNYYMKQLNASPEVQADIEREKSEYKAVVRQFVEEGELPASKEREANIDSCKVYIGDVFATLMQGRAGYYPVNNAYPRNRYVVVDKDNIEHATKHELNHAQMGGYEDRWLNEATTEHLAVSMKNGRVEPVGDVADQGVYNSERRLLDVVMTKGAEPITTRTLLWGYTEDKSNRWHRDQFKEAVDRAWGSQALYKIQAAIEGYEGRFISEGKSHWDAESEAARLVRSDLLQQPEVILGESHAREKALV